MSLDFVLFGVPRSGTTAAADALNLHPLIMCGMEYFTDAVSASSASVPAAFEDPTYSYSPNCEVTRELYLRKKGTARVFGNKDPRLTLYAETFHATVPHCKKVCIYRPRLGFWDSWDARANDTTDGYWERGQTGFFGVLELLCLLNIAADISTCGEILIVNYDSLFFDDAETIEMIFNYLGVERDATASSRFKAMLFRQPGRSRFPQKKEAREIYRYLQLEDLEKRIFTKPVVSNQEIVNQLLDYRQFSRPLASRLIDASFSDMSLQRLAYFLGIRNVLDALARHGIPSRVQKLLSGEETATSALEMRAQLLRLSASFEALR